MWTPEYVLEHHYHPNLIDEKKKASVIIDILCITLYVFFNDLYIYDLI